MDKQAIPQKEGEVKFCQFHQEKLQSIYPGMMLCESCLLEAQRMADLQFDEEFGRDYE